MNWRDIFKNIKNIKNIQLPPPKIPPVKLLQSQQIHQNLVLTVLIIILLSSIFGFVAGWGAFWYFSKNLNSSLQAAQQQSQTAVEQIQQKVSEYVAQDNHEKIVIDVVKKASPAVVSIVATKDVPIFERYYVNPFEGSPFEEFFRGFEFMIPQQRQKGTEKKEIAAGTGFIISEDGLILTNKHVVNIEDVEFTVYTNDGQKFTARVLAKDPFRDLAVLKIDSVQSLPTVKLGDSSNLQIGQTVIAIGNALGEFRNTVSVGVISGLKRNITAYGSGISEVLEDVIQTDAAINQGNSGGPLLNLKGEVIGVNTAMAQGAQNIGFAIPINQAKRDIEQVKSTGKISYPFLGIWYTMITPSLQEQYDLSVDYGAWIGRDARGLATEEAVIPGSPAAKAGLIRDDIILEINGQKLTAENNLAKVIIQYNPGDKIRLKVLRKGKELFFDVVLTERSE